MTPTIRKKFKSHGFKVVGHNISWSVIEKFHKVDFKQAIRFELKLTQKHVKIPQFCTMKVYLVTKVFSLSVYAGIFSMLRLCFLPENSLHTAIFIKSFDICLMFLTVRKFLRKTCIAVLLQIILSIMPF